MIHNYRPKNVILAEKPKEPEIEFYAAILPGNVVIDGNIYVAGRDIWKADEIKIRVGKSKISALEKNLRTEDSRVEFAETLFRFRKFIKKDVDFKVLFVHTFF